MQTICTSLQRDDNQHDITQFLQAGRSSWRPTNSVKAPKAIIVIIIMDEYLPTDALWKTAGPGGVGAAKHGGGPVQVGKYESRPAGGASVEDAALNEVVERLTTSVVVVRQQRAASTDSWAQCANYSEGSQRRNATIRGPRHFLRSGAQGPPLWFKIMSFKIANN